MKILLEKHNKTYLVELDAKHPPEYVFVDSDMYVRYDFLWIAGKAEVIDVYAYTEIETNLNYSDLKEIEHDITENEDIIL